MMRFPLPDLALPWPIPKEALAILAEYEQGPDGGCALVAYRCPAGVWTIGWGETDGVRPGARCTKEQADAWLLEDLEERVRAIRDLCTVEPSPNELGAFVLLAYNIGLAAFAKSTVLRQHNAGNRQAAARAFGLFNKARNPRTGQLEVLDGLTSRRAREAALYLTPEAGFERTAQAVEGESKLTSSPIAQGSVVTIAAGAVTAVGEVAPQLEQVGTAASGLTAALEPVRGALGAIRGAVGSVADFLGLPPGALLALVLVGAGWWILQQRRRQRSEGWA